MRYFELTCVAYIKRDIDFDRSFEYISKYINYSMAQNDLVDFHRKKGFKHYCFGGFLPIEKEKIYKMGSTYKFCIRSLDENFINTLSIVLHENINNPNLLVVGTDKKVIKQFFITELYSATPAIVTIENNRYWTMRESGDIIKLQKQLHDNLEKKYNSFFDEKLQVKQNFIQLIEIKNRVPQNIKIEKDGRKIILFGNKFKIVPNEDDASQKLAFTALACCLGEKSSYGAGFCLARSMR